MKKIVLFALCVLPFFLFSQGIYNNGANIVVSSGSYVIVDGGVNGNYVNANSGLINLDGIMQIEGNFTNNAANNAFSNVDADGTFIFAGTNQTITSPIANFVNFEKVTINPTSTTTLAAASGMTTNGTFTVNGIFTSESPADETVGGSLITNTGVGAITGTGTININRFFKVNGRWQYISVPMTNQLSDLFTEQTTSGNFNPNFNSYNEAFDQTALADPNNTNYSNYDYGSGYNFWEAWSQVQASAGSPVALSSAVGYICYNEGNLNTVFTTGAGNPDRLNHNVSYSPAVSYTLNDNTGGAGDFYDGWNLIGNPYQSALDWDDPSWTRTNISNTVYLWDGDNGNYVYHFRSADDHIAGTGQTLNSDPNARYIPAMQSFMVKATAVSPVLSIPAAARVHNNNQMYKDNNDVADFDYVKLQIANSDNHFDQTIVRIIDDAQILENLDEYDAYKAFATTVGLPQLSSLIDNNGVETPLAINSLPADFQTENQIIPLSVVAKQSGDFTFSAIEINTKYLSTFYLIDQTNDQVVYIDLLKNPEYTIFIEQGEYRDRFFLLANYNSANDIENVFTKNTSDISIHSYNKFLYLTIANIDNLNGTVYLYDALGRSVFSKIATSTYNEYELNSLPTGTYFVKYNTENEVITKKIVLN
ncbi:MAG: T9SS type A sorting domain-containing protein [Bacteroidales bacterium]|nr:T9SS type A sorting domain-containing protein [Bacteroidales bacterium]